jgi:hypothetical protein
LCPTKPALRLLGCEIQHLESGMVSLCTLLVIMLREVGNGDHTKGTPSRVIADSSTPLRCVVIQIPIAANAKSMITKVSFLCCCNLAK